MKILKVIGILLVVFGAVDLIGSFTGFDLWGKIGVTLPELLWKYSSYIEIGIGMLLFSVGSSNKEESAD